MNFFERLRQMLAQNQNQGQSQSRLQFQSQDQRLHGKSLTGEGEEQPFSIAPGNVTPPSPYLNNSNLSENPQAAFGGNQMKRPLNPLTQQRRPFAGFGSSF